MNAIITHLRNVNLEKNLGLNKKKAWCLFYYSVKAGIVENNN